MILKAEGISRRFFRKNGGANFFYAVQKTDFTLEAGKLCVIMGRSGSGKSTFLNMLAGLLEPSEGRVMLDNTDIYAMDDKSLSRMRNKNIGVIPQGQTALSSLTVLENVKLPYLLYNKPSEKIDKYAAELIETVGISTLGNSYPNELSGGENRRLAIARALLMQPGILLADEPTGDLDDENTKKVLELLKNAAQNGTAVLLVTHENDAANFADSLYKMDGGVLSQIK